MNLGYIDILLIYSILSVRILHAYPTGLPVNVG